jgi:hypothetical protein
MRMHPGTLHSDNAKKPLTRILAKLAHMTIRATQLALTFQVASNESNVQQILQIKHVRVETGNRLPAHGDMEFIPCDPQINVPKRKLLTHDLLFPENKSR